MNDTFATDEDQMIYRLTVHRNMITWFLQILDNEGIQAERTTGNDPKGDIVLIHLSDVPHVQQLIQNIQADYMD